MSISRRTLSSSRSSLTNNTSVSRTRAPVHPIITYFSTMLAGETDLTKITIVCYDVKLPGHQIIFNFAADTCGVFYKCRLTTINNFMRHNELYHTISPYGEISQLLYTLVTAIINQNTPIKTKKTLGIVLTKINQERGVNTSLINSIDYTVDKTERGAETNNECPICLSKFENVEKITLKCYHRICRDCLFNSVDNNLYTCPMCRKPFFPVRNPSSLSGDIDDNMDGFDGGEMA